MRTDDLPDWLKEKIREPEWEKLVEQLKKDVERNFDLYRRALRSRVKRTYREEHLVQGYHDRALLAELERHKMGRELNRLQQRIGRQRKANQRLAWRVKELEKENSELREQRGHSLDRLNRELGKLFDQESRDTKGPA